MTANTFSYEPLPSSSSVRLLNLDLDGRHFPYTPSYYDLYDPQDVLACSLSVVDLHDGESVFDALSYTWGNPRSVFEDEEEAKYSEKRYEQKLPIFCNGAITFIRANLHDFLIWWRHARRHSVMPGSEGVGAFDFSTYLWVDAICIDQENLKEKESQVGMMHEIYPRASKTLVWIGMLDKYMQQGFELASELADSALQSKKHSATVEMNFADGLHDFAVVDSEAGLTDRSSWLKVNGKSISEEQWCCLYALLFRTWFRRAWVVQEIALSSRAFLVCDIFIQDWTSFVLGPMQITEEMAEYIQDVANSRNSAKIQQALPGSVMKPGRKKSYLFESSKNTVVEIVEMLNSSSKIRYQIANWDAITDYEATYGTDPLTLLRTFSGCKCMDLRDKVYAFMGIANWHTHKGSYFLELPKDYSKDVTEAYTATARMIINRENGLRLLSYVSKRSGAVNDLPSWVPDWSSSYRFLPLWDCKIDSNAIIPWNACGSFTCRNPYSITGNCLEARGKRIGVVQKSRSVFKSSSIFDQTFEEIIDLFFELPDLFEFRSVLSDLETKEHSQSVQEGNSIPLEAARAKGHCPSLDINASWHLFEKVGNLDDLFRAIGFALPKRESSNDFQVLSLESPSVEGNTAYQTRFEAFWRTLIWDTLEGEHPAPSTAGFRFKQTLWLKIQADYMRGLQEHLLVSDTVDLYPDHLVREKNKALYFMLMWSFDERSVAHIRKAATSKVDPETLNLHERVAWFFSNTENIIQENPLLWNIDPGIVRPWNKRIFQTLVDRKIFSTNAGLLGNGPEATQEGDEVWVLASANVPHVLRPLGGGKYEEVGAAYVHGMMHGEALIDMNETALADVTLI